MNRARSAHFIFDAGYFDKSSNDIYQGYKVDYVRLRLLLASKFGYITRAFYHHAAPTDIPQNTARFYTYLRRQPPHGPGFELDLARFRENRVTHAYCKECAGMKPISCRSDHDHRLYERVQKQVDVRIVMRILTHMDEYDALVLGSGDGDLVPAVQYAKTKGKSIFLVGFHAGMAPDLEQLADGIVWMDQISSRVAA